MRPGILLFGVLLAGALGCAQPGASDTKNDSPGPSAADAGVLESAVLPAKPANAISVREALNRKEGDKVVLSGRVPGGKLKPFNSALAAVVLMMPEDLDREEIQSEFDCDDAAT
jgi:hypothetical protein